MRFLLFALIALASAQIGPAAAQLPPDTADRAHPAPATPLPWKWKRLGSSNSYVYWVERPGRPLILAVPAAPGSGQSGFTSHFARFLYDKGYALGVISWRGDRARKQLPALSAAQVTAEIAQARAIGRQGAFDPDRMILFGNGEGGLLAALLSADRQRLAGAGTPPPAVCATMLLGPANLDPTRPDTHIARRLFAADPGAARMMSPLAKVAEMPATLVLTDASDRTERTWAEPFMQAMRAAGRPLVHETLPRFQYSDEGTYLGLLSNRATPAIERFLSRHCPTGTR